MNVKAVFIGGATYLLSAIVIGVWLSIVQLVMTCMSR